MSKKHHRTVIAAYDGSEQGLATVARGREIAERAEAQLLIVHVIEHEMPYWSSDNEHRHRLRDHLTQIFESAKAVGGETAETRAVSARSPVEGLVDAIEDEDAGVVVVGVTHHGPIGHAFYGDMARQIGKRCDCFVAAPTSP